MGIIRRQALKGTVFTYVGVILAFFTSAILFPRFLSKDEIGITRLLVSYALVFAQFSTLGFTNVTMRLFPYFRNNALKHQGFLKLTVAVTSLGFLFMVMVFFIVKSYILHAENSEIFSHYAWYILPITFFFAFFSVFEAYNRAVYDSVTGVFLKEFAQRLFILIAVIIYALKIISFNQFVFWYVFSVSLPTLMIVFTIGLNKQLFLSGSILKTDKAFRKEIINVSIFGILQGFSLIAISNIDVIMVSWFTSLQAVGIYSTCVVFGILVILPSRPLMKISSTLLANAWKDNDMDTIEKIYYKSCINQFIIGVLIFAGIWINVDHLFSLLPPGFEQGKYVIFFIMLANLSEMLTGLNGTIINTSVYYKASAMFTGLLVIMIIAVNVLLIPLFGITGAAVGVFISNASNSLFKYWFLYKKFKMNPLNYRFIFIALFGIGAYIIAYLLTAAENIFADIFIKSAVIIVIYGLLIIAFRISDDLNAVLHIIRTKAAGIIKF